MERKERQQVVASQTKPYMGIDAAHKRHYIWMSQSIYSENYPWKEKNILRIYISALKTF